MEQAGGFVEAQHHVEILNRLSGGAFAQIVDRGEHAQGLRTAVSCHRPDRGTILCRGVHLAR